MTKKFGDTIASALEFKEITQAEAAQDLHMNTSTLNNYIKNKREPDVNTMIRILLYFDVDLNAFFELTPSNNDYSINKEEAKLLKLYRSLDPEKQRDFLDICEKAHAISKNKR